MREQARKRRDFIQNLTIAVLSVTAVLLFVRTQIYNLSFLPEGDIGTAAPSQSGFTLTAPIRVAVASGSFGRYGNVTLTTADEDFEPLRGLLEQALGSAGVYTVSDSAAFLQALEGTSVYYDFLTELPLSVLAELVQASGEDSVSARRLALAERGGGVSLYLWDESGGCLRCDTALSLEALEEAVVRYELGSASFAFEHDDPSAQAVAPCTFFLEELPSLPELSVSVPLSDADRLLTDLGFNPNTQNRYTDASGAEVVTEKGRTLRIHTDGTLTYRSGGDPVLSIASEEETPTRLEAAVGASAFLSGLLSPTLGDAGLYLKSIRQTGGATVLEYGYQVGGVPVHLTNGQAAAQVSLTGNSIFTMTIRIRQYTAGGTDSLLLPLRQALAIAAQSGGEELFIGYTDSGTGTAAVKWLAE